MSYKLSVGYFGNESPNAYAYIKRKSDGVIEYKIVGGDWFYIVNIVMNKLINELFCGIALFATWNIT
ncbi:hypothetical protein [Providencia huashanensis]|uniref:hypothetical protein n=1 Tax=Providencia huashanensis TaxID=3037798 RepID=UPI0029416D4A|nr:hypothetical protein [Providencia rettgeri]HEM8140876.1 hypothetical protein [Providencia rettgeri]